jgi:uncharacterized protein YprB with RNaseH-like and TPR domain
MASIKGMALMDLHSLVSKLKELASEKGRTPTLAEFTRTGISKRQILKHKYSEIVRAAGLEPNKSPQTTEPVDPIIKPPRILFFDIETAPITGYTWGTYEQSVIKVLKDWFVLSYAAKFRDDERFFYLDQRFSNPIDDDFQLLCGIHHLISECDYLVGHNSIKFDTRKLNARFIKHGLAPLNHYTQIDTLRIARKHFAFTSNKLADLAKFLECDIQKSTHSKFPGFTMWDECMRGNKEAFEEMESYNKTDVDVLIAVFNKLAPWEPSINFQAHTQSAVCSCGSGKFHKDGFRHTKQGRFQVFRCIECAKIFTAKENLIDKDVRKGFFK